MQNIFGDNAVIRSLIAANLDVDTLFAREATINALNAMDITSNTYLRLMVAGKADKTDVDALGERVSAAELKLTKDAIVSTVRGSEQYQQDQADLLAQITQNDQIAVANAAPGNPRSKRALAGYLCPAERTQALERHGMGIVRRGR